MLKSPFLLEDELDAIKSLSGLSSRTFSLHYQSGHPAALAEALDTLCADVEAAVRAHCEIVILSDRVAEGELDPARPPIPTLLAVGAVHHHLIRCALCKPSSRGRGSSIGQLVVVLACPVHNTNMGRS